MQSLSVFLSYLLYWTCSCICGRSDIGTAWVKQLAQRLAWHRSSAGGGHSSYVYWSIGETQKAEVTSPRIKPLPPTSSQREGGASLCSGCAWNSLDRGYKEMPFNHKGWHWARHFSAFYKRGLGGSWGSAALHGFLQPRAKFPVPPTPLVWFTHLGPKHSLFYSTYEFPVGVPCCLCQPRKARNWTFDTSSSLT